MPCRWGEGGLGDFAGRVRFRRRFGWPGRIEAQEHVWLTFQGVDAVAEVWLNGQYLGRHEGVGPFAFEVTSLLRVRNELVVEVTAPAANGGLWGEVALEVRLRD
jgi:beta-mannosidase